MYLNHLFQVMTLQGKSAAIHQVTVSTKLKHKDGMEEYNHLSFQKQDVVMETKSPIFQRWSIVLRMKIILLFLQTEIQILCYMLVR